MGSASVFCRPPIYRRAKGIQTDPRDRPPLGPDLTKPLPDRPDQPTSGDDFGAKLNQATILHAVAVL